MDQLANLTLTLATALLVFMTVLPLSHHAHWLVRGMDFPRLQLGTISVALLLAQLAWLDPGEAAFWWLVPATLVCAIWQFWWIAPYTPFHPVEVQAAKGTAGAPTLSILVANVLTSNRNSEALLARVADCKPDIVVTLESDAWWQERLDELEPHMPHTVKCPLDNLYGMHVYSRLPLHEPEVKYLVEHDKPSVHALVELSDGQRVRVHFLHPAPPSPTENVESAERDAELIIVARSVAEAELPTVVTGDLNDVAWSRTTRLFRKLSGLLDPRIGRGMFNTFHADYPFMRWPLDHLFHSEQFSLVSLRRLPSIGSDHFPIFSKLVLSPQPHAAARGLEADSADEALADDIVEAQCVSARDVPAPGER